MGIFVFLHNFSCTLIKIVILLLYNGEVFFSLKMIKEAKA